MFGPGRTWLSASISTNCWRVSQPLRSTSSRWAMARTPPKPCSASRLKVKKRSPGDAGCARAPIVALAGGSPPPTRSTLAHRVVRRCARPAQTLSAIAATDPAEADPAERAVAVVRDQPAAAGRARGLAEIDRRGVERQQRRRERRRGRAEARLLQRLVEKHASAHGTRTITSAATGRAQGQASSVSAIRTSVAAIGAIGADAVDVARGERVADDAEDAEADEERAQPRRCARR